MTRLEADDILKKYNLTDEANKEFKCKTRNDIGKMDVGLRLRICAEHLDAKWRELRDKRSEFLKNNNHECPNYELAKQQNPYAHQDCNFLCMVPSNFCYECEFYLDNIKDIDDAMKELSAASECFRKKADYDDTWQ